MSDSNQKPSLKNIFIAAIEKDHPAERAAFLDDACGDNEELRRKVERLIANQCDDDFLENPAADLAPTDVNENPSIEGSGTVIGPYKLLQKIGAGGFGVVYMADQKKPVKRRVALKIIKLGMDAKQVVGRFEMERQALAMMEHPNIAKVFDAGATESGRPYFVMELVKGIPVTQYCDENNLTTQERLELFVPVCKAIQHAHQKGIIHRDIKPSNIMITLHDGVPVPKVIDFGIAKATQQELTAQTVFTQYGQFIGTPTYMSPEQAEMSGLDIDTRSDIYSLGVLLYELITGRTPLDFKELLSGGLDEIRRRIREEEPPKPSTRVSTLIGEDMLVMAKHRKTDPGKLSRNLRGDLDWIVMKALEKDRTRRYDTPNELVADLKRFLNDEPVSAAAPSLVYQFQKFARRHKTVFRAAITITAVILVGSAVAITQAIRATKAAIRATKAEQHAVQLVESETTQRLRAEKNEVEANRQRDLASAAQQRGEEENYYANIQLAGSYIRQDRIVEARKALMACPEEYRHWEWGHLLYETHQEIYSFPAADNGNSPGNPVFGPNGKLLAIGYTKFIEIRDLATGKKIHSIETQASNWSNFVFHPSLPRFLLCHSDGTGSMVDAATGRTLFTLEILEDEVLTMVNPFKTVGYPFNPDGSKMVTFNRDGDQATIWDTETGQSLRTLDGPKGSIEIPAYSSDGKRLVSRRFFQDSDNSKTILVWDASTGNELFSVIPPSESFKMLTIHPNGEFTATLNEQGDVKVWEAKTGRPVSTLHQGDSSSSNKIGTVLFEPNGILVRYGRQRKNILWDIDEGRMLHATPEDNRSLPYPWVQNHTFGVFSDGKNTARIWDPYKGGTINTLRGHFSVIRRTTISPDGRLVATAAQNGVVKVWMTRPPGIRIEGSDWFHAGDYSPDGKYVAGAQFDRLASVWETQSGNLKTVYRGHMSAIHALDYSPDGRRIVTGSVDKTAHVWDAATAETLLILRGHTEVVSSAVFSPNGKIIATGSYDNTVRIWDAETGVEIFSLNGHQDPVIKVAFSPDGKILATGGHDTQVKLWEVETGRERVTLKGHTKTIRGLAFNSDGSLLASAGDDTTIRIWEVSSGKNIRVLPGRTALWNLRFSPDDQRLYSVSSEGSNDLGYASLDIWDVKNGRELLSLKGHTDISFDLAHNAVTRNIATFGIDHTIRHWITFPWDLKDYPGLKEDPLETRIQQYAQSYWTQQLNLEVSSSELDIQQISEQLSEYRQPRSLWPERKTETSNRFLDLTPYYNGLLNVQTIPPRNSLIFGDDLSGLPQGEVVLEDVLFDVRGVIQLASQFHFVPHKDYLKMYPERVNGISVNLRASRLHFLHGTHVGARPTDEVIGSYILHYEDGSQYESEIQLGRDVQSWGERDEEKATNTSNAEIAWRGSHKMWLRYLYYLNVENPHPDLTISHLDFVSKMTTSSPFLVAVTAQSPEDSKPVIDAQPLSLSVHPGESATFQVEASFESPLNYQWSFNAEKIPDATQSVLILNSISPENAGEYSVLIGPDSSESVLATTSERAVLTVSDGAYKFGTVKAEWFDDIGGNNLEQLTNHIRFPHQPDRVSWLNELATPLNSEDNYGLKISGVLFPPKTGDYTFYLNSWYAGNFYLSRSVDQTDLRLVAVDPTPSIPRQWLSTSYKRTQGKNISQLIALEAGEPYYFEALLKSQLGNGFLGVTWKVPGGPEPTNGTPPIPGKYLAFPVSE